MARGQPANNASKPRLRASVSSPARFTFQGTDGIAERDHVGAFRTVGAERLHGE
jgi:hypothetical protein